VDATGSHFKNLEGIELKESDPILDLYNNSDENIMSPNLDENLLRYLYSVDEGNKD
jgi:hypothetical protein